MQVTRLQEQEQDVVINHDREHTISRLSTISEAPQELTGKLRGQGCPARTRPALPGECLSEMQGSLEAEHAPLLSNDRQNRDFFVPLNVLKLRTVTLSYLEQRQ
jgi:hypothetical protein